MVTHNYIILGLGLGIIYLPRLDCITQYFDKKRPFVTGIAICGSGIGTFIMASLTDVLLNTYDWKTCLVILGGICFVNCFFGLMFKPLPKYQVSYCHQNVQLLLNVSLYNYPWEYLA